MSRFGSSKSRVKTACIICLAWTLMPMPAFAKPLPLFLGTESGNKPEIESGFNLLYRLKFSEARRQFTAWQQMNPGDPLGYTAEAAGYLFEELYRQHVLSSEFFLDNRRLLGGIDGRPDPERETHFREANQKGRTLGLTRLSANPNDTEALFALTLATGMQADFAAILQNRKMESLSLIKQSESYAKKLLALQPDAVDAWLALGAANYIIGCLPAYKRFFLWFGRVQGDKSLGMQQLEITAENGHYLKPFAKILLALAAMRERREDIARAQLRDLADMFPENPLFQAELARLGTRSANSKYGGL